MARLLYAASPADYFINPDGSPNPTATAAAWTASAAGSQITDMLDASSTPTTVVTADSLGGFRFYGPDGYTDSIWVQGSGGTRYEVKPTGLAERVTILEAALAQELTDRAAGDAATLDSASDFATAAVQAHVDDLDPHNQYLQILDEDDVPIATFRLKLVGAGGQFPSVTANRILFYGGN